MKKLGSLVLGVALSAGTQAATVSYDFTSDQADTDFRFNGRLGLFDSALGTLTGVTLEVYGEFTTALSIGNAGKTTMRLARAKSDFSMYFNSSLAALDGLLAEAQEGSPWVTWAMDTGNLRLAPYSTVSYAPVTEGNVGFVDASSLLDSFTVDGGGDFGLTCATKTLTSITIGANGWFSQSTTGACSALITYTYDEAPPLLPPTEGGAGGEVSLPMPVPEPPSLAVLGLGLGFMALRRSRSRKPATA